MILRSVRFLLFSLTLAAQAGSPQKQAATGQTPPSSYIDKGACPFECCTYREWTANQAITLLDQPNGKNVVAQVRRGEKVQGVTGEVHSIPLRTTATHDDPGAGLKAGDVFYVLHYEGEGMFRVWHNGKLTDTDDVQGKGPRATWWVQIKTAAGVVGWAISRGNFANQDACG